VVLVSKCDVLPHFDFNLENFDKAVSGLNPKARIFPLSSKTGEGMAPWLSWLEDEVKQAKKGSA
jgi:hydrogenase nickel incorporation protein HypB